MTLNRIAAAGLALLGTLALAGTAGAAPGAAAAPQAAPQAAPHAVAQTTKTNPAHGRHALRSAHARSLHKPAGAAPLMAMHERVAKARAVEQERGIAAGLHSGRLDFAQAAALERAQAGILTRQATLARRGHESVEQALDMQHRQDLQDWAVHTAHPV